MPVNSVPNFDPFDEDSWFFGFISRVDATELLTSEPKIGAFLVRESTTAKGDLVLSVKVKNDRVSHYIIKRIICLNGLPPLRFKIGDQEFNDIQSLLEHYMQNDLDDTPLTVPVCPKDTHMCDRNRRSFTRDYLASALSLKINQTQSIDRKMVPFAMRDELVEPIEAVVVQSRIPNAYDKKALTLKVGDVVKVTKMNISGCWEGEVAGKKGHFPFKCVEFRRKTE